MKQSLCNRWEFTPQWTDAFGRGECTAQSVRLPHTAAQMPLHYCDSNAYQMVCGYRRSLVLDETMTSKRLFLQFDGAAHIATVYLNGQELTTEPSAEEAPTDSVAVADSVSSVASGASDSDGADLPVEYRPAD